MTVSLGAQNLFDQFPGRSDPSTSQSLLGILTYSGHSPFGMNGRFVYARVTRRF